MWLAEAAGLGVTSRVAAEAVGLGWAVAYTLLAGILGILLMLLASAFIPRILNRLTPNLDEEKEIARGNVAVAEYFGRVVAAGILGVSIVVAAAVAAGIISALL